MATAQQLADVRAAIGESASFTDEALSSLLAKHNGNVALTIADVWNQKAGEFAELTDISEGSSSRQLSSLYRNAIAMAEYWSTQGGRAGRRRTVSREVVRATDSEG